MFHRAFVATVLLVLFKGSASLAQPLPAPDCTVEGRLTEPNGLVLDISYRCRAAQALSFQSGEDRALAFVSDLKVEQRDGLAEARYRFDLTGYARAVDSTRIA